MFYESENSLHSDLFKIERGENFSFPMHMHTSFELITVEDGELTVTVGQSEYLLKKGEAVLVFPNQIHSLQTKAHSQHLLCIFSPQLVKAYKNMIQNQSPKSNLFRPNSFYLDALFSKNKEASLLQIKGLLYSICAEFDTAANYAEHNDGEESLLMRMFKFVEVNHATECTLRKLAEQISYHEVYLSRYFKKCTGRTFANYVNQYRINEGAYILRNSKKKIVDVALECGFDSLRSFNRNFKAITGKTPNEYRNGEPELHCHLEQKSK